MAVSQDFLFEQIKLYGVINKFRKNQNFWQNDENKGVRKSHDTVS